MICRQGTFVEYSVFGKETTVDWTMISDAKGTVHPPFVHTHQIIQPHFPVLFLVPNLPLAKPLSFLSELFLFPCGLQREVCVFVCADVLFVV